MARNLRVSQTFKLPLQKAFVNLRNFSRHFGTSEQLQQLAQIIVGSIGSESTSHTQISIGTVTARLLRRADFYELRQLQGKFQ